MISIYRKKTKVVYKEILIGDAFIFEDELYIKTADRDEEKCYYSLNTKVWKCLPFEDNTYVTKTNLEMKEID